MSETPIPLSLRAAVRGLSGIECVRVTGPWKRHDETWAIPCRITIIPPPSSLIPAATDWYVIVEGSYPYGSIKVYPAKLAGLTRTYQHQSFNAPGKENEEWRSGKLCLDSVFRFLGRTAFEVEPFTSTGPSSRLVWHLRRAVEWVEAAAHGRLTNPGEPFELPEYPSGDGLALTVVYSEDVRSLSIWQSRAETYGVAELTLLTNTPGVLLTKQFQKTNGELVFKSSWGRGIAEGESFRAGWVRLPDVPIISPWQAPSTWGELWRTFANFGPEPLQQFTRTLRCLRDSRPHLFLLGFPLPAKIGDPVVEMHWHPIALPALSSGVIHRRGFRDRDDPEQHWQADQRTVFRDDAMIDWQKSENWSADTLATRGRLAEEVRPLRTAVLGCGALGSAVGELVIRTGLHRVVLVDDELLEAGNLCRHTLLIPDIKKFKAESVGKRLVQINPHVDAVVINHAFPPREESERAEVKAVDLVIDCTAEDTVIREMGVFPWGKEVAFVSIWLGLRARRLYCFTARGAAFPVGEFDRLVQPWLTQERAEGGIEDYPREGVGCWHPVFPARLDDIWLLVAAAVKHMEYELKAGITGAKLVVFEQENDSAGFCGIRRVAGEVGNGRARLSIA